MKIMRQRRTKKMDLNEWVQNLEKRVSYLENLVEKLGCMEKSEEVVDTDQSCTTCKHGMASLRDDPCFDCDGKSAWVPVEGETI